MIDRTTRLRWRRRFRYRKRQVEDMGSQAEENLERHFFRRVGRLSHVRRFIAVWVLLVVLLVGTLVIQTRALGGYYLKPEPVPGGTYTEGILGSFTNANPLYAVGTVDSSVSRLIFASLFKYDQNNQLVGDLASSWTVDEHGTHYAVHLQPNLTWQDGQPLTAADVVFTYQLIQNPDAKSPLISSWQGISVVALDPATVVFTLPNPLSSFPDSLINGIVPQHKLSGIPASQLRSVNFNTANPIGAGPFKWQAIEVHGDTPETREERIALAPNADYHAGPPKLDRFIIRSFYDQKNLLSSFGKQCRPIYKPTLLSIHIIFLLQVRLWYF
jgi:ABC-type transport system substrate-binding protein